MVECEGQAVDVGIEVGLPVTRAVETDLLGRKLPDVSHGDGRLSFPIEPWRIRNLEIT